VVHPINSAGKFRSHDPDAEFVIRESYVEERPYVDIVEADGLRMRFASRHRSLERIVAALNQAGLLVELVLEVTDTIAPPGSRWQRVPLFLDFRAVKP
jgi:hypothetical protein